MLFKQLAFAATAAAFLVVPEMTEAQDETYKTLPVDLTTTDDVPASAMGQNIEVPCYKCKGQDTHLSMEFNVEDGTRLTLNGYELYPNADPWRGDLTAAVVKGNGKKKEQMLGYSLAVGPQAFDSEQSLEIINVGLHIIEVGGRFVDGIPTVDVKLIKAPSGEILIGSIDTQRATQPDCSDVWCRIRQGWDDAWSGLSSCSKGMAQPNGANKEKIELEGQPPYDDIYMYDDSEFDWSELLEAIVFGIILPVLTGITAGIGVAVFAMGIGSFIAILLRSRRRCRRASRRSKTAPTEPAAEEEKAGLMEEEEEFEEPPPVYGEQQTNNGS